MPNLELSIRPVPHRRFSTVSGRSPACGKACHCAWLNSGYQIPFASVHSQEAQVSSLDTAICRAAIAHGAWASERLMHLCTYDTWHAQVFMRPMHLWKHYPNKSCALVVDKGYQRFHTKLRGTEIPYQIERNRGFCHEPKGGGITNTPPLGGACTVRSARYFYTRFPPKRPHPFQTSLNSIAFGSASRREADS